MFRILPGNFFVPLSSPNRIVYWDCICKLFTTMQHQLSFGVERDVLVDELEYYFDQTQAAEMDEEEFQSLDSRGKANSMLRKLEFYGWIEIETDKSYVQRVNFQEYAVKIIKTLLEIADGKQMEYQGYIYTIYSLARSNTDHPGIVLLQILENTDMLITGLKNLNSSIKHYMDELTRHKTVSEIMHALFNDYITNIVDKAYHRLLTSDNVSKFRPEIIERLESKSRNEKYLTQAVQEIASIREVSEEEGRELVYQYLHMTIEAFRNMDDILEEINQKNTQYQRAAINRAKFLLSGDEDIRGQLKEILLGINETMNEEKMELGGIYKIEFLDELIRIYSSSVIDENSLYAPTQGKKTFVSQDVVQENPDLQLRQEKIRRITEKMQKILSPVRIETYVNEQLGEKKQMQASQFPLNSDDDFIKLIYIRLYGQRKNMNYQIEVLDEIQCGEYHFKDYMIRRKS